MKFVSKKYVRQDNYVLEEATGDLLPMEAYLLMKLDHRNIVKVSDSFLINSYITILLVNNKYLQYCY